MRTTPAGLLAMTGVLFICSVATGTAQNAARATVSMKKGDTVEGVFRSATASEITIEIAGQLLKIPVGDVRYVSFVGRVEAGAAATVGAAVKPAAGSLEDAYAALDELQRVVRVGVLRDHYSENVVAILPRVVAYLDANEATNPDLSAALRAAIDKYRAPLGEVTTYWNPWKQAPLYWESAARFVAYAREVAKESPPHKEVPETRPLTLGQEVRGRLGNGDRVVPASLNSDSARLGGYVADMFQLKLPSETKIAFTTSATPDGASVLIVDSTGKTLDSDYSRGKKTLKAGAYQVWVATRYVGTYSLMATVQPR